MAMLISRATGNFTSSSTWGVADSATGSQLTNPSASTSVTGTSYTYSSTFTGTNASVCDGIALFLRRNGTTGTITVALSDDNGTTATRSLTVNAGDLPADESWVFFEFGSTLTLDGGTDYRIGVLCSSGGSGATVYRDGTANNWARIISTTTTAAPAATDTMLVVGELTGAGTSNAFTVTMNSTANTDYGTGTATATVPSQTNTQAFTGLQIGVGGTLTWGTSAATNHLLRLSGNLVVWSGGTYNMGTTGTPCPRDSSMQLEFDCAAADGDHGFCVMNGATVNIQGQSRTSGKNVWWTLLNTDEAIGQTVLGVADDTGWLSGDRIAIASTTRTRTESETRTLSGNATATELTVSSGLTFAHSGTSPTQAEVILLTRNVRIQSVSSTHMSYMFVNNTPIVDIDWCEFRYMGTTSFDKFGIACRITTGSLNVAFCAFSDSDGSALTLGSSAAIAGSAQVLENCCFWSCATTTGPMIQFPGQGQTAGTFTLQNIIVIGNSAQTGFQLGTLPTTATVGSLRAISCNNGIAFQIQNDLLYEWNNFVAHSNNGAGLTWTTGGFYGRMKGANWKVWRNNNTGLTLNGTIELTDLECFGNLNNNMQISGGGEITLIRPVMNGDTSFSTSTNISGSGSTNVRLNIINGDLSTVSGIKTAATNDLQAAAVGQSWFGHALNTKFGAATEFASQANMGVGNFRAGFGSMKHDQVSGAHRMWKSTGTISSDTSIFNTASPSERITPINASQKLESGSRLVPVDSGSTKTISVYVRKSATGSGDAASYNGNQPRLVVRRQDHLGVTSDTVLDTMTASGGSWEQLSGTTASASEDGAFEVFVDCDGTTGWINVDDWSVS